MWALTALTAPFYALLEEAFEWATASGVDQQIAETYIASMFHAISALVVDIPEGRFSAMIAEAATPRGLNEQALAEIREQGGYKAFLNALDSIIVRLGEKAPERQK